jgi:hypothetical protein
MIVEEDLSGRKDFAHMHLSSARSVCPDRNGTMAQSSRARCSKPVDPLVGATIERPDEARSSEKF